MVPILLTLFVVLIGEVLAQDHPCLRECSSDPKDAKVCHFEFSLVSDDVLDPANCGLCPVVQNDCSRPDCIPLDGGQRRVYAVNHDIPGPPIRVCVGDTVTVDVTNNLLDQGTSIHWHGITQKGSQWADGVPRLTQFPISSLSTFRYEFNTTVAGSYFWHSHEGLQRGDGAGGLLIVRQPTEMNIHADLYDYDLPEHELLIQDWLSQLSFPPPPPHTLVMASNILINGKGYPAGYFEPTPHPPIEEVRIESDKSYRFRLVNNGITECPIEVSIENHKMKVIAADGFDIQPVDVQSLVIFAGERYDFVLTGNQPIGSYWIKFRGLFDCELSQVYQVAVLNYEGVNHGDLPSQFITTWDQAAPPPGIQLNPFNEAPGTEGISISIPQLQRAKEDDDPEIIEREIVDHQFYLEFDTPDRNGIETFPGPQLNFISLVMPEYPPLLYPQLVPNIQKCNAENFQNCSEQLPCQCTHWLQVELNSIIEVVLVDGGHGLNSSHPLHFHGHSFRVVAMEKLGETTDVQTVKDRDRQGLINRVRSNAPIKDVVPTPNGGYTIFRFRADNPGFWLLHCHIEIHAFFGLALILEVGDGGSSHEPSTRWIKKREFILQTFLKSIQSKIQTPKTQ